MNRISKFLCFFSITLGLYIYAATKVWKEFQQQYDDIDNAIIYNATDSDILDPVNSNMDAILIEFSVISFNPLNQKLIYNAKPVLLGKRYRSVQNKTLIPKMEFILEINSNTKKYAANKTISSWKNLTIADGNVNNFFNDQYQVDLFIACYYEDSGTVTIPLAFYGRPNTDMFFVVPESVSYVAYMDDAVKISYTVQRSRWAVIFSIYLTVIMWLYTLMIAVLTYSFIVKLEVINVRVITFGMSSMFSLSFFRKTQPNIPQPGVLVDIISYYWDITIIALCTLALGANTLYKKWK